MERQIDTAERHPSNRTEARPTYTSWERELKERDLIYMYGLRIAQERFRIGIWTERLRTGGGIGDAAPKT